MENIKNLCLPDVYINYPCQPGSSISESFSERMISADNLLINTHRARLDHKIIDKMTFLCMSKRFMERARLKEDFASIMLHDALSDEHTKAWNY